MKSLQHLFADLTATLEDLHGVAVEAQAHAVTPDMHASLLSCVRAGIAKLEELADTISSGVRSQS